MRKKRIFLDTWQSASRARILYKAARCGWLPVQRASRRPACHFRTKASCFPHKGMNFILQPSPPESTTALLLPPHTSWEWGPWERMGRAWTDAKILEQGGSSSPFLLSESLGPWGESCPKGKPALHVCTHLTPKRN